MQPNTPRGGPSRPFSFRDRLFSFRYAFAGLRRFFATEHNAWLHLAAAAAALTLSVVLKISAGGWIGVLFAIGLVLSAEAFNTCIEKMLDKLIPEQNDTVRYVKDLAAGAVLLCAITAAAIGAAVFIPAIMQRL